MSVAAVLGRLGAFARAPSSLAPEADSRSTTCAGPADHQAGKGMGVLEGKRDALDGEAFV